MGYGTGVLWDLLVDDSGVLDFLEVGSRLSISS